ncbi:MAG TPA: hypothetical protein VH796_15825 [Nitrososphaeraceae archaeon]
MKGKVTSQRVLDIEGPSVETSLYANGSINGVQVKVMLTLLESQQIPKDISWQRKSSCYG